MNTKVLILRVSNGTLLYCIKYSVYLKVSNETLLYCTKYSVYLKVSMETLLCTREQVLLPCEFMI